MALLQVNSHSVRKLVAILDKALDAYSLPCPFTWKVTCYYTPVKHILAGRQLCEDVQAPIWTMVWLCRSLEGISFGSART